MTYTYTIPYPSDDVMERIHYLRWMIKFEIGYFPEVKHSSQEMKDGVYFITITCEFLGELSDEEQAVVKSIVENTDRWVEIKPTHSTEIPIDDYLIDGLLEEQFPDKHLMYIGKGNTYRICGKESLTDEELKKLDALILSTIKRIN